MEGGHTHLTGGGGGGGGQRPGEAGGAAVGGNNEPEQQQSHRDDDEAAAAAPRPPVAAVAEAVNASAAEQLHPPPGAPGQHQQQQQQQQRQAAAPASAVAPPPQQHSSNNSSPSGMVISASAAPARASASRSSASSSAAAAAAAAQQQLRAMVRVVAPGGTIAGAVVGSGSAGAASYSNSVGIRGRPYGASAASSANAAAPGAGGGGSGNGNRDPERNNAEDHDALLWENGGAGSGGCRILNSCNNGWSEVDATSIGGTPPSARSLHAAALLNGVFYCFGGYDGSQRVNTFHAFSFSDQRWTPVLPSAHSSPPPSPRDRHIAVAFRNSVYIQGGFDGHSRVSDFWQFDLSTMCWREVLAVQGRPPTPRHSHAAVVYNSSLWLFGGYDGSYKNDLHEYDFTTSTWTLVPAAGRRPRARYRATCVVHKNLMILYGGHDGTRHLSDTHVFDFDTRLWSVLHCEGTTPIPRDSHVSVVHGNCMYVFGGSSGSAMNDLHELTISSGTESITGKWRPVHAPPATTQPSTRTADPQQPRPRFCHVAVVYNDSMWIFGGYDGADRLNDFIRFDFAVYDLSFEVPPSTILSDLRSLINDSTLSDITFVVDGQELYAHKVIMMRCPYFQALFLGQMRESSLDTIHLEQVRYPIFLSILEYLYTDHVNFPLNDAMELFEAADLFCIPRLKTMCEKRMLQSITVENAASIFHAADMHSAAALRQKTKKYILSHFEEVSKSRSFEEMGRRNIELVFELLQSR